MAGKLFTYKFGSRSPLTPEGGLPFREQKGEGRKEKHFRHFRHL